MLERKFAFSVLGGLMLAMGCAGARRVTGSGTGGAATLPTASTGAGGASAGEGGRAATGGTSASGGAVGSGGWSAFGGATASGGAVATGGTIFPPRTGGAVGTGGNIATGGVFSTGGHMTTGGATSFGGTTSTRPASGGASSLGGAISTGGRSATGGVSSVDAGTARDGASPTGGTTGATPLASYVRAQGPLTLSGMSNASGITWKPEADTFFIVDNMTHSLYEYTTDFKTRLRTVVLNNGATDTEDVVYLGANRFAVADERNEVYVVTIADGATSASMSAADVERYSVTAPPATTNRGFEGVTFRPGADAGGEFIVCQEGGVAGTPSRVLFFDRRSGAGTSSYADGTLVVREPWNASSKLGSVATDLAAVCFDAASSTLLVLSQESSRLLRVAPTTGEILDQRDLSGSPQYEGVTLAAGGRLVLVSEPNYVEVYRTP